MNPIWWTTLTLLAGSSTLPAGEIIKEEKVEQFSWVKVHFDGHTYIQCLNKWNFSSNQVIHDPGCSCRKNRRKLFVSDNNLPPPKKEKTND